MRQALSGGGQLGTGTISTAGSNNVPGTSAASNSPSGTPISSQSRSRSASMRNHLTTSASLDKAASALIHEQVHS